MLVNHPTVRERSTSSSASRPCPSRSMRTAGSPVHRASAPAKAASRISSTRIRYAGVACSSARVSSAPRNWVR
ncbi:hypothetical protein BE08_44560 [Sorangium cellulosum]|uniref:Uncharacterized protein n=1 Tax=Sorangium cellulosum TaxID=56 RepID=A0A150P934_SORCE|nr:hypothetical protein BE08_44560 [Sorangium cellulosum]